MSAALVEHWAVIMLALLATTFNLYRQLARTGQAPMGAFFYRYGEYIEFANWLLVAAGIVFLSFQHTWWLLLLFFLVGALGAAIAKTLGGFTQILYMIGMPVLAVLAGIQLLT